MHVIEQPRQIGAQVRACVVGAHAGDDHIEFREVALLQIGRRQQRHFASELANGIRHLVASAHHVADLVRRYAHVARTSFTTAGGKTVSGGSGGCEITSMPDADLAISHVRRCPQLCGRIGPLRRLNFERDRLLFARFGLVRTTAFAGSRAPSRVQRQAHFAGSLRHVRAHRNFHLARLAIREQHHVLRQIQRHRRHHRERASLLAIHAIDVTVPHRPHQIESHSAGLDAKPQG